MNAPSTTPRPGIGFIISAPSGAGKTSLVANLLARVSTIELSISHTTRQPRDGEVHAKHYYFVDRSQFDAEIAADRMLEYAEVFGNLYGTSERFVEERTAAGFDVVLEIDWQGAALARTRLTDPVSIMILPPSRDTLEQRLRGRGKDSDEVIRRRLAQADTDMTHAVDFDYIIVNDDFDTATRELAAIVTAERCRTYRAVRALSGLIGTES
jgi:guanylate kinase